jgi:predicted alpha/beta superfamily hydrolase
MTQWQDYEAADGHTPPGRLKLFHGLASPQLGNERDLLVYLPRSYHASGRRYPVVYMHDGQNLFDPATSFAGEWAVDQTLDLASAQANELEVIVVGVPNAGRNRSDEYSPFRDAKAGGGRGDAYLDFLVDTVKPLIDASFRTLPDREHTGLAGSSLGALISLYGFFRRPDVFGFVGAMSPSLWFAGGALLRFIEDEASYTPGRVYLDAGTAEGERTVSDVARLRGTLVEMGYTRRGELVCITEPGAGHNERAWARRLLGKLRFLLGAGNGYAAPSSEPREP